MRRFLTLAALMAALLVPTSATGQITINEMAYGVLYNGETQWVELTNQGSSSVDVSSYYLCNYPFYSQIGTLGVLSGSTTIEPGGFLVVKWTGLGTDDGEIGLYSNSSFESATGMLDYVEYGTTGHFRSSVAETAGLWATGQVVAAPGTGESIAVVNTGAAYASMWAAGSPSPGVANGTGTDVDVRDGWSDFAVGRAFPNPASFSFAVPFSVESTARVSMELFNLLGKRVAVRDVGQVAAGNHTAAIDTADLPPGLYLCRIQASLGGSLRSAVTTVSIFR